MTTLLKEKKQILVLTPIYPANDIPKEWTPVVHYFTREWVKQGNEIHVINYVANFPKLLYCFSSLFKNRQSSKAGYTIRTTRLRDKEYDLEGVHVYRIMLSKTRPHMIGYRSAYLKQRFEIEKKWIKPSFMCYSGIPASYNDNTVVRDSHTRNRVAYVGTLIKRKFPSEIIPALCQAFGSDFTMGYAGEGEERKNIEQVSKNLEVTQNVHLLGLIPRDKVIELLDNSDLFIMISRSEIYGLVYLEAMARGCITIASRREGFDGIIRDGGNGFYAKQETQRNLHRY